MGVYARSAEIIRRVRLEMPVKLTLQDPATGKDFVIDRDNLLSLLVIDSGNIFLEGQTVAAFFVEMARAQRACERMCARAEVSFAQWKAQMVRHFKATQEASGKKGTDKDAEANYRSDENYKQHAHLGLHYKFLGYLFCDIKDGFAIKADMIRAQVKMQGEHEYVTTAEVATDEVEARESTERLEELAATVIGDSEPYSVSPDDEEPSEEEEDEEEHEEEPEEEGEEEEEEEEEDDLPPPPPPPPKRATRKKKTAKRSTKKKTTRKPRNTRKRSKR